MPECIDSHSRLFADDTIVYRTIESSNDCSLLQADLHALEEWEQKWGMSFNPSKCETIRISRKKEPIIQQYILKNEELNTTKSAHYLGISISDNLSWNNHVSKTAAKGNRALGFIRRNIVTTCRTIKEKAYKALVRPNLEYASSVWSPGQKTLSQTIEKVQRRAARFVYKNYKRTESVTTMLNHLNWDTLQERRNKSRVTMIFKILNGLVAIDSDKLIPSSRRTRGHNQRFQPIATRTNYHKFSFFPSAITLWNSLPPNLVEATDIDIFKDRLISTKLS